MAPWHGENEGEKIVLFGASGMGKTTLAALAQHPIFIGADDGGRRIRNGITGEPVLHVPGVEDFHDVRDALSQHSLWPTGGTVVIDTLTKVEEWSEAYVLETVKTEKGDRAKNLEAYGYGKGYRHCLDAMRLVLQSLDVLVRRGVNVILVCQQQAVKIANAEGADYIQDGPKLYHSNQYSTRLQVCEWADHVFQIGYESTNVSVTDPKRAGKISGSTSRVVKVAPENPSFFAKSRTIGNLRDEDGDQITRIAFESPADDSLWQFIFPQE